MFESPILLLWQFVISMHWTCNPSWTVVVVVISLVVGVAVFMGWFDTILMDGNPRIRCIRNGYSV